MRLRFLKDYRSRQWMCRYPAGAVEDVDRPEVVEECLMGAYAVPVEAEPEMSADAGDE